MWKTITACWRYLPVLCIALGLGIPAFSQNTANATSLNGIALDATYLTVLNAKGIPHFVGPSLLQTSEVDDILVPPPLPQTYPPLIDMAAMGGDAGMGMMMAPPPPAAGGGGGGGGAATVTGPPKGRGDLVIWLYQGARVGSPDVDAGWHTYVIFDTKSGKVIEVIVSLTNTKKRPVIQTPMGISLGNSISELIGTYGYPKPYAKIGKHYFFPYPDKKIAFTLSGQTKRVIAISLGNRALTAIPGVRIVSPVPGTDGMTNGGMPGGMPGTPGMPGMPGGMPMGTPGGPSLPGFPGQQPLTR
ncbi:MAG TPA: hypothetical protein VGL77_16250 [Armatimonadota bacterium]|jgi:hypothetical protein